MKNKKSLITENPDLISENFEKKAKNAKGAKNFSMRGAFKKIAAIAAATLIFSSCASGCASAKSGKDGKNGLDGKNGIDGAATSVTLDDGKVTLDGKTTSFDGETLSAYINLSANDDAGGKVGGGGRYPLNTAVLISANPNYGYIFLCWKNEKGETVSQSPSFLTSATQTEQNYTAFFEIDKSKTAINVSVRADKSLPSGAAVEGGGRFAYGSEYTLSVTAENESVLNGGTVLFYEVTKEQFDDENFAVSKKAEACSRGRTARFDVDGLTDKYYLAAFIDEINIDVSIDFNISIEASCDVEVNSSNDFYGKAEITKINGKTPETDSLGKLQSIWAGDSVTVTATPSTAARFDEIDADYKRFLTVDRSDFSGWVNALTGEIVSKDPEYTFIAKKQVRLKAIFKPKTVLHFEASGITAEIITKNEVISQSSYNEYCGAVESFYPGEEIIVYANFSSPLNNATAKHKAKFVWQISYNNTDWETLSYSRQAYLKIPENAHTVYIKATFDRPNS